MDEKTTLTEIALVALFALLGGLGFSRLKQPPILGYILSGIILGPSCFALIQSRHEVSMLAELGVLLLLFVIGMELSVRSFKKVWVTATLCTILQITLSLVITFALGRIFNWPTSFALLLGFIMSLSSTAVVVKMLELIGEIKSDTGQITIGVLIAQDLAIIPMILLLKNQGGSWFDMTMYIKLIGSIVVVALLIIYLSRRQKVRMPFYHVLSKDKELMPLAGLGFCFCASYLSGLAGLSAAYGAFLAGLVIGNSHGRSIIIDSIKPVQDILMMVFFLSIGLLLDMKFILTHWGQILSVLLVITVVKTAMNAGILHMLRLPWAQSFMIGSILAQLGEFAFLLTSVAYENDIVNGYGQSFMIAVTVLSLALSPFWLTTSRRLKHLVSTSFAGGPRNIMSFLYGKEFSFLKKIIKNCGKKVYPLPTSTLKMLPASLDEENKKDTDEPHETFHEKDNLESKNDSKEEIESHNSSQPLLQEEDDSVNKPTTPPILNTAHDPSAHIKEESSGDNQEETKKTSEGKD